MNAGGVGRRMQNREKTCCTRQWRRGAAKDRARTGSGSAGVAARTPKGCKKLFEFMITFFLQLLNPLTFCRNMQP